MALSSETRIACKSRFKENEISSEEVIEDIFDRSIPNKLKNKSTTKKIKKIKKIKRKNRNI